MMRLFRFLTLGTAFLVPIFAPLHFAPRPGGPAAVPLRGPVLLAAGAARAAGTVGGEFSGGEKVSDAQLNNR